MPETPVACTLLPQDLNTRLVELAALSRIALLSSWRDDLILNLQFSLGAEGQVRRMVAQERECCAFLSFEIERSPTALDVRITAPESAREAVREIYIQFLAAGNSEANTGSEGRV